MSKDPLSKAIAQYFAGKHQTYYAENFTIMDKLGGYVAVGTPPVGGGNYQQGAYLFNVAGGHTRLVRQLTLAGNVQLIASNKIIPGTNSVVAIDEGSEGHSIGSYQGPYAQDLYGGASVTLVTIVNSNNGTATWQSPAFPGTADLIPLIGGSKQGLAIQVFGVQTGSSRTNYDPNALYSRATRIFQWLASKHTMDIGSIGVMGSYSQDTASQMSNLGYSGKGILVGQLGYLTGPYGLGYGTASRGSIYGYKFNMPYIPGNSILMSVDNNVTFNTVSYRLYTQNIPFGQYANMKIWSAGTVSSYKLESVPEPVSWEAGPLLHAITDNSDN